MDGRRAAGREKAQHFLCFLDLVILKKDAPSRCWRVGRAETSRTGGVIGLLKPKTFPPRVGVKRSQMEKGVINEDVGGSPETNSSRITDADRA